MTRWVEVSPERLPGWLQRFAAAHGELTWTGGSATAPDGAVAELHPTFPPPAQLPLPDLLEWISAPRRFGLLLVRLGGYAVGVVQGDQLLASKVGSRLVHGRSAAGGQSQQRFARRREGQAAQALAAAADVAARVLLPELRQLDFLVTGGDRTALRTVLTDRRLQPLASLAVDRVLDVADPRQRVLTAAVSSARAVPIRLVDPA